MSSDSQPSLSTYSRATPHVDALATVTSEDNGECLYGDSSTIAFIRQVAEGTRTADATLLNPDGDHAAVDVPAQSGTPIVLLPLDIPLSNSKALAVLPLRRQADDFLHCYWEFIHPLFPLLHKTSFVRRYESLWLPDAAASIGDEEPFFLSNLNLVLALGCQFSTQVASAQKASAANDFHQRSRRALLYDILGSTSISVVQWLLLNGIYLQSTSHASYCWNSIGLAIRHAQGLGLHIEHSKRGSEKQIDREMRRRIWHTCVILDR